MFLGSENGKELSQWLAAKIMILIRCVYGLVLIFLAKQGMALPWLGSRTWMLPALRSPAFISERVYGRIGPMVKLSPVMPISCLMGRKYILYNKT